MKKLNVSIVTYNHTDVFLARVIASVLNCADIVNELFIIDNSADDRLKVLAARYPLTYIHLEANKGYGAAHNVAIKRSIEQDISFHLILNPDIEFESEVLVKLLHFMATNPLTALVMPRICYPDGRLQEVARLLPNSFELFSRRFIPAKITAKIEKKLALLECNKPTFIPFLSGCFMFCRTSLLKKVDGFDERYFMYMEDMDLSRRLAEVGDVIYFPTVSVTHDFQKGSYKSKLLLKYHIQSAIRYYNKWGWFFDRKRSDLNYRSRLEFAEK
jgi:GT2 family glycosyltransferase